MRFLNSVKTSMKSTEKICSKWCVNWERFQLQGTENLIYGGISTGPFIFLSINSLEVCLAMSGLESQPFSFFYSHKMAAPAPSIRKEEGDSTLPAASVSFIRNIRSLPRCPSKFLRSFDQIRVLRLPLVTRALGVSIQLPSL